MPKYAKDTAVTPARSLQEIKDTIDRYGGVNFLYFDGTEKVVVMFEMEGRRVRFVLPLPDKSSEAFIQRGKNQHSTGSIGTFSADKYQQGVRQRWRALGLSIKAKLESVECGIETFEEAFLAHIMLPNGQNVGEWMSPQLQEAYLTAKMPPMLPSGGGL